MLQFVVLKFLPGMSSLSLRLKSFAKSLISIFASRMSHCIFAERTNHFLNGIFLLVEERTRMFLTSGRRVMHLFLEITLPAPLIRTAS